MFYHASYRDNGGTDKSSCNSGVFLALQTLRRGSNVCYKNLLSEVSAGTKSELSFYHALRIAHPLPSAPLLYSQKARQ